MPVCYRPSAVSLVLAILLGSAATLTAAQPFSLNVDSQSNLYASGHATSSITPVGGGTLPPYVTLQAGTSRSLTFSSVTGSVSYNDVDAPPAYLGQYNGPDGGAVNFQDASWPDDFLTTSTPPGLLPPSAAGSPTTFYMEMDSLNGISGLSLYESNPSDRRVMFLAGTFTTSAQPQDPAPSPLDFSSNGLTMSFTQLSPELNQLFFIGDGLTGTGTGTTQTFIVPDQATHLYLGIVDGSYFVGGPDYYDNNRGSFTVAGAVVPEPSTWLAFGGAGILSLATGAARRARRSVKQRT